MFNGKEDHEIPFATAQGLIRAWRSRARTGQHHGGFFGRDVLEKILAQPGCVGVRFYHATHEKGHDTLVLLGVSADGKDLASGTIAEEARPCPPYCDESDPLAR